MINLSLCWFYLWKEREKWFNGLQAMQDALVLERYVNEQLLSIHGATDNDPHVRKCYIFQHLNFYYTEEELT